MDMEEEQCSMICNTKAKGGASSEASNSNSPNFQPAVQRRGRRKRQHSHDDTHTSSSDYKGVVPQQNGNWGAQIYANHSRIWLGTFKTEKEAAMAYDSASILLRPNDNQRNITCDVRQSHEQYFQKNYTKQAILDMIKDGSYESKFQEYLMEGGSHDIDQSRPSYTMQLAGTSRHGMSGGSASYGVKYSKLFQKELTPSDVGKLNRLVIPKKYAIKYFPRIDKSEEVENEGASNSMEDGGDVGRDIELVFWDGSTNQTRKFRYCYWASSQSYVFTRGWNRFVKEKELKPNDVVTFYKYEFRDHEHSFNKELEIREFFVIDVTKMGGGIVEAAPDHVLVGNNDDFSRQVIDQPMASLMSIDQHPLGLVGGKYCITATDHVSGQLSRIPAAAVHADETKKTHIVEGDEGSKKNGFRLFGVQISSSSS